jgi:hypothetical protein
VKEFITKQNQKVFDKGKCITFPFFMSKKLLILSYFEGFINFLSNPIVYNHKERRLLWKILIKFQ